MPVDPATYQRFQVAEQRAKEYGLALVEVLDHMDLLLTQKRRHDIRVQATEDLWRRLERQSPNKLMAYYYNRTEGTSHEMFEAVKQWLALVVNNQAEKTLEDL